MSVPNNNIKRGDRVKIIDPNASPGKRGKVGIVSFTFTNGAMVKIGEGHFTPVSFKHLKKLKKVAAKAR